MGMLAHRTIDWWEPLSQGKISTFKDLVLQILILSDQFSFFLALIYKFLKIFATQLT